MMIRRHLALAIALKLLLLAVLWVLFFTPTKRVAREELVPPPVTTPAQN